MYAPPMVRALLADTKTKTRRVVKGAPDWATEAGYTAFTPKGSISFRGVDPTAGFGESFVRCPYGVVGDRLWVKETWRPTHGHGHGPCECSSVRVSYAADGGWKEFAPEAVDPEWKVPAAAKHGKNVTPLFMPRWASRITLAITEVRVERLQSIDPEDAMREGVGDLDFDEPLSSVEAFQRLWETINGIASWDANPWVWVISFRRLP